LLVVAVVVQQTVAAVVELVDLEPVPKVMFK